jgi:aminoglycoside 2''-phosphotransferase
VSSDFYRRIVEQCFPSLHIRSFTAAPKGWVQYAFEVNGEYIFRFPQGVEGKRQLAVETRLLPEVGRVLSLPVPQFEFVWNGDEPYDKPFAGHRKILGVPLATKDVGSAAAKHLAQQLGTFLSELHSFPTGQAERLRVPRYTPSQWRKEFTTLFARVQSKVFPLLWPPEIPQVTAFWKTFLNNDQHFQFTPRLVHRDLGFPHILWEPTRQEITGIIHWGDACVTDPAIDFAELIDDFGIDYALKVLNGYRLERHATFWRRVTFYARLVPFRAILYGLSRRNRALTEDSLVRIRKDLAAPPTESERKRVS